METQNPAPSTGSPSASGSTSGRDHPVQLDCAETRYADGSVLGISTQSAFVQALVAERCLIVKQELDTKYASIAADSKLLQRKLDNAFSKLNHELESNKKTWKEEAVRIWEAVDTHTHEVNMGPEEALKKTLSSLAARLDAVERRFTDGGGGAGISTESSAALMQDLVAEKCLGVGQELETKYASMVADTKLLQRKVDSVAAKLNHELESNKKMWKEEAVRLWEAVDMHTHSLNIGGSESMGTSIRPQGLQPRDGIEPPELFNDSSNSSGTPSHTQLNFGSAYLVPGRVQRDSAGPVALDDIGASLATLARQFPGARLPRENSAHQLRSPAQQFRTITRQGGESPSRHVTRQGGESPSRHGSPQRSPQAQFRLIQHQGGPSTVVGATTPPHFRWTEAQGVTGPRFTDAPGVTSTVRTRSETPSRQPMSMKVPDGAGSPQWPSAQPPMFTTPPLAGSTKTQLTGSMTTVPPNSPMPRTVSEVTFGPAVDHFSQSSTGPSGDGGETLI